MSNNGVRKFVRGDLLFSENDPIKTILLVQSGRVKLFLPRGTGIDVITLTAPFILGELALVASARYPLSATAMTEVSALEIPLEAAKQTVDGAPQFFKTLTKGLIEQLRAFSQEFKNQKLEFDPTPCPSELIPRLFGGLYHSVQHLGRVNDDETVEADWLALKKYSNRIFNLPQDKIDSINHILVKMGIAEYIYSKNPEDESAPEQLTSVRYKNFLNVLTFLDFYQFYFYKTGKQEILKYDEIIFNLVRTMIKQTHESPPDRTGNVKLDLNQLVDGLKKEYDQTVTAHHWPLLDAKGLFTKRAQNPDGSFYIAFHREDFEKTFEGWRFLREIHKWNSTGSVNPKEPEFAERSEILAPMAKECPDCKAPVVELQKFCSECGAKLSSLSAA
ncbi:MAG: hypothetical protein RJB66_2552 [Pseudomonadota bacterium]|jgi:hypothetical protein